MDRNELMNRIQTSGQPNTHQSERSDEDEISLTAEEMRAFVFFFFCAEGGGVSRVNKSSRKKGKLRKCSDSRSTHTRLNPHNFKRFAFVYSMSGYIQLIYVIQPASQSFAVDFWYFNHFISSFWIN